MTSGQDGLKSCVKIYLSSNPEDSVVERRALREQVFPAFRQHCRRTLALDVRVIDPFESSDPRRWPDQISRQRLITECRESSAGLFLLALVGHCYGRPSLPTQVEVTELQVLLQEGRRVGVSTQELERIYWRDENSIPPSYWLRLRPHGQRSEDEEGDQVLEDELMKRFSTAVSACVQGGLMTSQRAQSYCRSAALDADLRFALETPPTDDVTGRCLVYVHKVVNDVGEEGRRQSSSLSEASFLDLTAERLSSELRDTFIQGLVSSCQLLVYCTTTVCDQRLGYTATRRRGYAQSLCRQAYADLLALTNDLPGPGPGCLVPGQEEQEEQQELCHLLSSLYGTSRPEEDKVRTYLQQSEQQLPLVVTGGPCTGKAVLLAHCARQIPSWLPHCHPVVIPYFCTWSSSLSSARQLLLSLCRQIDSRYKGGTSSEHNHNLDLHDDQRMSHNAPCLGACGVDERDLGVSELRGRLSSLLTLRPSSKQPLCLILDGLDHMEKTLWSEMVCSLPTPLPPNVKVVLTATSSARAPGGVALCLVPLPALERKQCVKMVASLLSSRGRRVTSGQQVLVNQALSSCCLPLYVQLLPRHTALWRSDSDVAESSLPDGVHSSISVLLDHLEQEHGGSTVARALSYLNSSRTGLAEADLADLLSSEDKSAPSPVTVLQVDVERLLLDLRRFLLRRSVLGFHILSWVSRHFKLVVNRRYLSHPEVRRQVHSAMADYFGRQDLLPANYESQDAAECDQGQNPFDLSSSFSRLTLRKVMELPHHLERAGRWEEFQQKFLMSPGFHQAMVQAGLLGDLVLMLETPDAPSSSCTSSPSFHLSREPALLASILKSSGCLLQSSPLELPTYMETQLLPYLEVLPALQPYIQEIRGGRRRSGSGLGVALCPAPPSVPALHCFKCEDDDRRGGERKALVVEAAGTACGTIALVMDDGKAWFWDGSGSGLGLAKLLLTFEETQLKFAGVKSSGQFVLLSTRCDKHFLWEATGPEVFVQVQEPPRTRSSSRSANTVEGFVVACRKVFLRWTEGGLVSVFDVSTATSSHFHCESRVTCLVCSSDGLSVYCGRDDGSAAAFDSEGRLLSSWTASYRSAVALMILCEDKGEVACIDRTGNVRVWSSVTVKEPPRLLMENLTADKDPQDVLSTDHLEEVHTLLVCQAHQVTLWGTCDWELWHQFLAPRGRSFSQAVLAQGGSVFLALLDASPQVLVWRVGTGECVLALASTEVLPHKLIKTTSDVVCVSRHGRVAVWSSEMIHGAAAAPRMGQAVTLVAVEESSEGFYTGDGSEVVWRWDLPSGLPYQHFLHDGPVAKLRLSPGDAHLVTLAAGDVYVWETATGQNLVRAAGSRASDIVVAPSGQLGVSLSETWLSRVWRLAQGGVVCSVRPYLADAQVTPESTFLVGRRHGDLLAASLWSGCVSKRFSCAGGLGGGGEEEEEVVAFQTLSGYPDLVAVLAASGALYTWKVAEETVCRHFRLPTNFHCQPGGGSSFQMSRDGAFALLSTRDGTLNVLDLTQVALCSIRTEGRVATTQLDSTGRYAAYVASTAPSEESAACCQQARPLLQVVRLADGARLGSVRLPRRPSALLVSYSKPESGCVFVGFADGAVAVYAISDAANGGSTESLSSRASRLKGSMPHRLFPLPAPNVTWH